MVDSDENGEHCQRCGEKLARAAGRIVCPNCLMRLAIHPSPSEIATAAMDVTQSVVMSGGETSDSDFPDLTPGQMFGDYRIAGRLGHGGMGVVYEADHTPTARRVALKVMGHSLDDRDSRARFLREGRLAASINHPNSVYVYGTEEIEGRPTISMELVRGGTLGQWVKAKGRLSPKAAVDAILQIIDGMEAAYNAGVLHRDIKPNNCFVDAEGHVKIGDFGLSITAIGRDLPAAAELARTQTEITQVGTFLGTPSYASPEQLRGEPLDHRSDIYSIGITLYYLVVGQVPFVADNMVQLLARVLDNTAPSLKDAAMDAPPELDRIITKCLKKAPGDRFASYGELRDALMPLSSRVPTPATLGSRFLAAAIDYCLLSIAISPISIWLFASRTSISPGDPLPGFSSVTASVAGVSIQFLYFALCEWRYGKTLGKRMLRLQVIQGDSRPSLAAAVMRSLLFIVPPVLPSIVAGFLLGDQQFRDVTSLGMALLMLLLGWSRFLISVSMFLTVRARNGNAAVHDLVSGTRVVESMSVASRNPRVDAHEAFDAKSGTERIGPYHVLRPLGSTDQGELLLGYDATLLRRVWLHVRSSNASPLTSAQRNAMRTSRLRWLGGQVDLQKTWDAYEALSGWQVTCDEAKTLVWHVAKDVLGQLADELSVGSSVADLPEELSIQNVWVTEGGQLKLLPFGVLSEPRSDAKFNDAPTIGKATKQTESRGCLRVLRDVGLLFADRYRTTNQGTHAMSLSDAKLVEDMQHTPSLESAKELADTLRMKRSVRVPYRVAGMLAATLMLPIFTILSSVMMTLVYQQQEASMPEARELAGILTLIDEEFHSGRRDNTLRVNALKTYVRANYSEIMDDDQVMFSVYGQTMRARYRRTLNEISALPDPSESEAEAAAALVAEIRELHSELPRLENSFTGLHGGLFWATLCWIEMVWLPSLLTGLLFRGGVIVRMFGLTFVNRSGKRASGLRVFIRMLATGIVPVCVIILLWTLPGRSFGEWPIETVQRFSAASVVIIACLAVVIYRSRRRLFSDRFAGTYLVAR